MRFLRNHCKTTVAFMLVLAGLSMRPTLPSAFSIEQEPSPLLNAARYSSSVESFDYKTSAASLLPCSERMTEPDETTLSLASAAYKSLPLSFEANYGQTHDAVKFLSRGNGYSLFLCPGETVMALSKPTTIGEKSYMSRKVITALHSELETRAVLRMKLLGANPKTNVTGVDELAGKSNYFIANNPTLWHTNISNYSKVKYEQVYPGIDMVYYGNQTQHEYDFVIAPRVNPNLIKLRFEGQQSLVIDALGDLVLRTANGDIIHNKPAVYQEREGAKQSIEGRYVLKGKNEIGFDVGAYDESEPLVIDPSVSYSTFLGGNDADAGNSIAVDSSGSVYVTGETSSTNFPTASGYQPFFGGGTIYGGDAFVTKLNSTGSALVYSTYLGGSDVDRGKGIAVDGSGNAYITGETFSANFPLVNATQAVRLGVSDAFVARLGPGGGVLFYSTYLGGYLGDSGAGIVVDGSGNAYVTGNTNGSNFPILGSPYQATYGGGSNDGFVVKLAINGAFLNSTYLGGNADDSGNGIARDSSGNVYVTGSTASTNFPTALALQPSFGGGVFDAFVTKLNSSLSGASYSTYLGGSGTDIGLSIALDSAANAYVTGSAGSGFPTTAGAFQGTNGGGSDAFVAKVNAGGGALGFATYLGGNGSDQGKAIAVSSGGTPYITGITGSTNFPLVDPLPPGILAGYEPFVARLDSSGASLLYSTFLIGPTGDDEGRGIALNSSGIAYITGKTGSTNFLTTVGAFQTTYGGGASDAFVAKIYPVVITIAEMPPGTIKLWVSGAGFTTGSTVTFNGVDLATLNQPDLTHVLLCKKAGNFISPGQTVTLVVRNPDGALSQSFQWTRPL